MDAYQIRPVSSPVEEYMDRKYFNTIYRAVWCQLSYKVSYFEFIILFWHEKEWNMRDFEPLLFWGREIKIHLLSWVSFKNHHTLAVVYKAIFIPCTFDSYTISETEYIIAYIPLAVTIGQVPLPAKI